jgi:HAD superfamily hydrolase (TIGR01662 family)
MNNGHRPPRAVFFDVDFTLIHPGRAFQAAGYRDFCARHGVVVDERKFDEAVAAAAATLDPGAGVYDSHVYVDYTRRIIEGMGGSGEAVDTIAREIFAEWALCHHFVLYDDVPDALRALRTTGVTIGLISNSERCMASFETHFELDGLFDFAITSVEHGYMKPHPSIFEAALARARADRHEAVMVGDSVMHDIEGARRVGMRAVLVARSQRWQDCPPDVPVISSLRELPGVLFRG